MDELGIDIRAQRSTQLTPELVAEMDYIFGLAHGHVDNLVRYFPQARRRFLLREFVETLPRHEREITDPFGGSLDVYQACRDEIKQVWNRSFPFWNNNQ